MRRVWWFEILVLLALLVGATVAIAVTNADLAVSGLFYFNGGWPVGERFPWKLLYHIDRTPALMLAGAGGVAAVLGFVRPGRKHFIRPGLFLLFLLVIGPGLIVNAGFKDHWGRPRPREVLEFGGNKQFLQPWQPGISGHGRSFPSGHSSAAFYMSAPYLIYRRRRKNAAAAWLTGGLVFGVLMSIARIAQGGHFLSDTLWSFGIVAIAALIIARLLEVDQVTTESGGEK